VIVDINMSYSLLCVNLIGMLYEHLEIMVDIGMSYRNLGI
jgi:hypothetical protein